MAPGKSAPSANLSARLHAFASEALRAPDKRVERGAVARDWRRPAMAGYAIIFFAFGVMGSWAAFARLDSAVVAPGTVTVESSRKTVAHLEGGIVRQILVREGQHVEEGQVLIKLDDTQPQAGADMSTNQLASFVALEARLIAERDHRDSISYPPELAAAAAESAAPSVAREATADQRKQFEERRNSLAAQVALLQAKVHQYETELEGLAVEKASTLRQLVFIEEELKDLRGLLEKQLVPKSRVMTLEREKSRLEGVVGRSTADASKARNGIGESRLQIDQLQKKFAEDVNSQLLDARQKIADLRERTRVSSDVLRRIEIRSPRSGVVQNVKVATLGGIIRPGEPLLELIPDGDELIINAQVSLSDIDIVNPGMDAEVRFSAFHGKIMPVILGQVESLSRDRLLDEATRQPYFLARVIVKEGQLPVEVRERVRAGMAVEVVIPTGERTMADYLVRPLTNRARKALREQ